MLKKWLERPLLNQVKINRRLEIVGTFLDAFMERESLRESLKSVYDLERLSGRIAFGNVNARDLIQLKQSLQKIPAIKETLGQLKVSEVTDLADSLIYPDYIVDLLEKKFSRRAANLYQRRSSD